MLSLRTIVPRSDTPVAAPSVTSNGGHVGRTAAITGAGTGRGQIIVEYIERETGLAGTRAARQDVVDRGHFIDGNDDRAAVGIYGSAGRCTRA